jgi:hypothetical protein
MYRKKLWLAASNPVGTSSKNVIPSALLSGNPETRQRETGFPPKNVAGMRIGRPGDRRFYFETVNNINNN